MELSEIRKEINQIDDQIKDLLMERMECSRKVAYAKKKSGDTTVYRPDREKEILERLGEDVDPAVKKEYLATVKKIMSTSRILQYDLLFEPNDGSISHTDFVTMTFSTDDIMSVLSVIRDRGFTVEHLLKKGAYEFEVKLSGDIMDLEVKRLLFQLEKETRDFSIIK